MFVSVRERAARSALRRDRALGGWEHTSSGEVSPGWVYKHGHAQDERGAAGRRVPLRGPRASGGEKKYVLQPIEVLCGIPYTL